MSVVLEALPGHIERLRRRREPGRGFIVIVDVASLEQAHAVASATQAAEFVVVADAASEPELTRLNAQRDLLLAGGALVVLIRFDGDSARRLRFVANDLTSAPDAVVDVAIPGLAGEALRSRLDGLAADRHRAIVLTGLIPHAADVVELDLATAYMPSVWPAERVLGAPTEKPIRPLVVLAQPGAGKTTFARYLARSACNLTAEQRHALPGTWQSAVYVPLSAYANAVRDRSVPIRRFVEEWLLDQLNDAVDLHETHNVLIVLDGLDEVPSRSDRIKILRDVSAWFDATAQPLIVTGREHLANDITDDMKLALRTLSSPTAEDREAYVSALLSARHPDQGDAAVRAEELCQRIARHEHLKPFADVPLLLTFVVILSDLGRELPDQRTVLYRDLVEMLIGSWRHLRTPGDSGRPLRRADVLRVLAPLGWHIVERGGGGVDEATLLGLLIDIEGRRESDLERAQKAAERRLYQLRDDTALLRVDGQWQFTHPTLAEYFAALAVLQDEERLATLCADPYARGWEQVVVFAMALAVDIEVRDDVAERLCDALIARSKTRGRYDARFPTLLVAVLTEVHDLSDSQVEQLANRALHMALVYKLSHESGAVAAALIASVRMMKLSGRSRVVHDVCTSWFSDPGHPTISWRTLWDPSREESGLSLAGLALQGSLNGVSLASMLHEWRAEELARVGWWVWLASQGIVTVPSGMRRLVGSTPWGINAHLVLATFWTGPPLNEWQTVMQDVLDAPENLSLIASVLSQRRVATAFG